MLAVAAVLAIGALACYTIGVWAEQRAASLATHHTVLLLVALLCNGSGTLLRSPLLPSQAEGSRCFLDLFISATGTLTLVIMAAHVIWALVISCHDQAGRGRYLFHRFSPLVWLIWLVPCVAHIISGIVGLAD